MDNQNPIKEMSAKISNSVTFKIITMIIIVLLLLIPAFMIESLIHEREYRKKEVIAEIGSKWGQEQTIAGPIISIPYKSFYKDKDGRAVYTIKYAHFLPDSIDLNGMLDPEMRYRGIYEAVLYKSQIELAGTFPFPEIERLNTSPDDIIWSGAFISIGITDMRGIKNQIVAEFNGDSISMSPGLESADIISSGVSAKISLADHKTSYPFKFKINLNGSHQINFVPVGRLNDITVSSTWPDPSFSGAYLPYERTIGKDGFSAKWKVLDLNRNYPQYWKGTKHQIDDSSFGVELFIPVDIYQKSMRTVKYAIMFIVFTFIAFFFSEIMKKVRVHPIQYLLIGLAIMIFYTLLISISEHTNFNIAYIISSISVIALITGYAKSILKKGSLALMVGGMLVILYGYLYIVLQLEDFALLMGSIGLFIVLALVMYFTRKIDWYAIKFEK
ncbi:MAG: cell envelope integrity protein CreD [candidate division Zixibacteria bacterium]|nr:cell envelope integrity protein CreD [candidate division Zixibacteria bacterium]